MDNDFVTLFTTVHPLINVYEELIITRLGSTVTLQCTIEASPKAVHFWVKKGTEPGQEGNHFHAETQNLNNSLENCLNLYQLIAWV